MAAGIRGCVINEKLPIFAGDPAIGKDDIRYVADTFLTLRGNQVTARFSDEFIRLVEFGKKRVNDIAKPAAQARTP